MKKIETTLEEILQTIKDVYDEHGKISSSLYTKHGKYSERFVCYTTGKTFGELVELAGLPTNMNNRKGHSKEDLIADVLRVYNELGEISRDKYLAHGKYSRKPIIRHFGNWNNLLEELNIELNQTFLSDEELLNDLIRLYNELGSCGAQLIKEEGIASLDTYQRRFGSINEALEKAGLPTRKAGESIIEDQVINKISMLIDEKPICQKRFDWLRNDKTNRMLPVDAYFPDHNLIVEYNGKQHYEVVSFIKNDNEEQLAIRQYRDNIKYKLIKEQGINLLVIKYDESIANVNIIKRLAEVV